MKKLRARSPPYGKAPRPASTNSPYEVISRRPLSQAVSHYVTTCLHPNTHPGSLRGKEWLFWRREPQAGRKAAIAAVPGVLLRGTRRCSPARPGTAPPHMLGKMLLERGLSEMQM